MKKSEINSYIKNYILPRHEKYFVDRYVMYKLFDNDFFIKGYLFYSKGDVEMGLKITYFITPLFVKDDAITFVLGEEILNIKSKGLFMKEKKVWWDTRKENQTITFENINEAIKKQGEPILNSINNANELCKHIKKYMKDNIRVCEVVAYSTILFADLNTQDNLLKLLIRGAENERDADWIHRIEIDAKLMLSIKSIEERIKLLKSWANQTIKHLKLPHIKPFAI